MVIFIIFAPPHYPSRVKGYSQLLLCEAPKCGKVDDGGDVELEGGNQAFFTLPKDVSDSARRRFILDAAFLATTDEWAAKERVGSRVTPNNFGFLTVWTGSPPTLTSK